MLEGLADEAQKLRDRHLTTMEKYVHGTDIHTISEVKNLLQKAWLPMRL